MFKEIGQGIAIGLAIILIFVFIGNRIAVALSHGPAHAPAAHGAPADGAAPAAH
jgi:hypothetical protein